MRTFFFCLLVACGGDDATNTCSTCDAATSNDGCVCVDSGTDTPFICDPAAQTGCPSGQACYTSDDGNGALTYSCATPGIGMDGANCTSNAQCATGFFCIDGNQCAKYCQAGTPNTPPVTCPQHSPACTDSGQSWGYCLCLNPPGIGTCP